MAQDLYNFEDIKKSVVESVRSLFPISGRGLTLHVDKVEVADNRPENDLDGQYAALTEGKTWGVPVYATVSLRDKNGVVDTARVRMLDLPKMTPRKTFIVNGQERQVHTIMRRKSGVYSHTNEAGDLVSEFNLDNGLHAGGKTDRGKKFQIRFDDENKQFMTELGTKKSIPTYDLLKALGKNTEELRAKLGDEVHAANSGRTDRGYQQSVRSMYTTIYPDGNPNASVEEQEKRIQEAFGRTQLNPDIAKAMLGHPYSKVTSDTVVDTMDKLLKISQGDAEEDDRESLVFKNAVAPPQLFGESIGHRRNAESIRGIIRARLNRKERPESVRKALPPKVLDKFVHGLVATSPESDPADHPNPVGVASGYRLATMIGTGGIKNMEQIPINAPLISPSHLGFIDPLHTPEGGRVGINLHMPLGVRFENDQIKTEVVDRGGEKTLLDPAQMFAATVAFADEYDHSGKRPRAVKDRVLAQREGKIEEVDPKQVQFILPRPQTAYDHASNLMPFLQSNSGSRALMAGKHSTQAIPLKFREQPLVQTGAESDLAEIAGARFAPASGVVKSIAELDGAYEMKIKGDDGKEHVVKAYRRFPTSNGIILDSDIKVKVGDKVKEKDLMADSTFTKDGNLAMGTNLQVAYMPWKGYAFEDGVVISRAAADKLTSLHLHEESKREPKADWDKEKFQTYFRSRVKNLGELDALDKEGLVKKGTKVEPGQLLMAVTRPAEVAEGEQSTRRKIGAPPFDPVTMVWDKDVPGTVTEVKKLSDGTVRIFVQTEEPLRVGDKIVGRNANKAIVVNILDTAEMPHTKEGKPVDLLLSPLGIPGRINLGQVLETATGKLAQKQGQPIVVAPFGRQSYIDDVDKKLKDAGLSSEEVLVDPTRNNKEFGKIFTGPQYIMKLEQQVSKKLGARSAPQGNHGYDRWDTPLGGDGGAQSLGELGTYALLAHGAVENLREMQLIKSQRNEGLWDALLHGKPVPVPNHLTTNDRFEALLRVAGVKLNKGDTMSLIPQTDADTVKQAGGRAGLKDAGRMLENTYGRVKEEPEGMFDPVKTGGMKEAGKRWSYFDLPEPVMNPIFTPAVASMTGWDTEKLTDIAEGRESYNGMTGGAAIKAKLAEVDLPKRREELLTALSEIKNKPKLSDENKAKELSRVYKELRYVTNLEKHGSRPEQVYVMSKVPVLPPILRPVSEIGPGERVAEDINHLYRDLALVAGTMDEAKNKWKLSDKFLQPYRESLQDGMSALVQATSTDKPLSGSYRGVIGTIIGKRPSEDKAGETGESKRGLFQDQIVHRRQDFSGRSTITVEPRLRIDEVGIPFEMAHTLYEPWGIKKLRERTGWTDKDSAKYYRDKGPDDQRVREALAEVVKDRPVILKRDPVLHKFNVMSFHPQLVEGKAIQINPLVTSGFNADFDGDAMSVYVPISDRAVREASDKLTPSKNLFSPANSKLVHKLGHEMVWGLNTLTEVKEGKATKDFKDLKEATSAWNKGEIQPTQRIRIGGKETTAGWATVNAVLPEKFRIKEMDTPLTADKVNGILAQIAHDSPDNFAYAVDKLRDIGNEYSTEAGLSVALSDFKVVDKPYRDQIFAEAQAKVRAGADPIKTYGQVIRDVDSHTRKLLDSGQVQNNLYKVVGSGARASYGQLKQIITSPMMVYDPSNRIVPRLITNSYSEGLSMADYWTSSHGARKGAIDKSVSTAKPGYLSKQVMRTAIDQVVSKPDCGTTEGVVFSPEDSEIEGRTLARDVEVKGPQSFHLSQGSLITPEVANMLRGAKVAGVVVRSPMRCELPDGVCAKCMGHTEEGKYPSIGTNVGVMAAQSIGEPSTQLSLNVFHQGGIVEDIDKPPEAERFKKVEHLLRLTQKIPNSATLAPASGKVTMIEPATQGGHNIRVENHSRAIHIPSGQTLLVEKGQEVKKGQPITPGISNPLEVLRLNGAYTAQESIVNQLHYLFKNAKGVKKRHFETVVRGMTQNTQIVDPGKTDYLPGQVVNLAQLRRESRDLAPEDRPKALPLFKGIGMASLVGDNWVARLNSERLRETIVNAANQGWEADMRGTHPIPPITFLNERTITENTGYGRPIRHETQR
jgi:DNA-directed RNA polymerase subunit beta'